MTLIQLMNYLSIEKWPYKMSSELSRFYAIRQALSVHSECLLYGNRVVIPKSIQGVVLRILHEGHLGINRMKALARAHIYWTNINNVLS